LHPIQDEVRACTTPSLKHTGRKGGGVTHTHTHTHRERREEGEEVEGRGGEDQENNTNTPAEQNMQEKEMLYWSFSPRPPSPKLPSVSSFSPTPHPPTLPPQTHSMKSFVSSAALMGLALLFSTVHAQPTCPGVTLKAPRAIKAGRDVKLTARLTNAGTTTINEGGLSLTLPPGVTFVAASTFPKQRREDNEPVVRGQVLTCAGITLAPRKKLTFRVKARVSACAPATGTVVPQALLQGSTCGSSTSGEVRSEGGGRGMFAV